MNFFKPALETLGVLAAAIYLVWGVQIIFPGQIEAIVRYVDGYPAVDNCHSMISEYYGCYFHKEEWSEQKTKIMGCRFRDISPCERN